MARLRAVLFDIDGTLLDSNDAHAHAWLDALRGHGRDVPFDLVRQKIGMGGDKLLMDVARIDNESAEGKSLSERRAAIFKALYLSDLAPLRGGRALVERLRAKGIKTAVVTSASSSDLADLLRVAAVAGLFDVMITADDADNSKPDPDLVKAALDKLGVGPREVVMIGDTPYDIVSAGRAGVSTIAVRSGGGWSDRELASAIAIYDDPQDLLAHYDESPLALGVDDAIPPPPSSRRLPARPTVSSAADLKP